MSLLSTLDRFHTLFLYVFIVDFEHQMSAGSKLYRIQNGLSSRETNLQKCKKKWKWNIVIPLLPYSQFFFMKWFFNWVSMNFTIFPGHHFLNVNQTKVLHKINISMSRAFLKKVNVLLYLCQLLL